MYESGAKYEGFFKNNKRHGKGVYTYPSLEKLEQQVANQPKFKIDILDSVTKSFSGEWEEDFKVRGVLIYRNGCKYDGQLFNDLPNGKGVYAYESG
jgi:hypothetical protein